MYYQIQKILRDEGGVVVPMFANSVFATSEDVHYGELGNNGGIDGRRLIERWSRS